MKLPKIFAVLLIPLLFATSILTSPQTRAASPRGSAQIAEALSMAQASSHLQNFTDAQVLGSVRIALDASGYSAVQNLRIWTFSDEIGIGVSSPQGESFYLCHFHGSTVHCGPVGEILSSSDPLIIPFEQIFQTGGFDSAIWEAAGTAGWVGAALVSFYVFKKVIAYRSTGSLWHTPQTHSHFFKTPDQMRDQITTANSLIKEAEEMLFYDVEADLLSIALSLSKNASCGMPGHDHGEHMSVFSSGAGIASTAGVGSGFGAQNRARKFSCEGVSEDVAAASQKAILQDLPRLNFQTAKRLVSDFAAEARDVGAFIAQAIRGAAQPLQRQQIFTRARSWYHSSAAERGRPITIAMAAFIIPGTALAESLESMLMPAGAHLFCQVGNVAVVGAAMTAYTALYCVKNFAETKGLPWRAKFPTMAEIMWIQLLGNFEILQSETKLEQLTPIKRQLIAFMRMAKTAGASIDARHNLGEISRTEHRRLSTELGQLRKSLNLLMYRSLVSQRLGGDPLQDFAAEFLQWTSSQRTLIQSHSEAHIMQCWDLLPTGGG